MSRGVQIYNVTCGNGTWDSVSDHSLVSGDLQWSADPATQNKRISKAMLKNPGILQQAKESYEEKLLAFIHEISTVSSNRKLEDACLRFGDILRQPFESNRGPRPDRYRFFWDNHLDTLEKQRSKIYRKWKRRGHIEFWQKYKDLDKLIKRTTRDKKRALLEEFSRPIQDETPSLMAKRVNTVIYTANARRIIRRDLDVSGVDWYGSGKERGGKSREVERFEVAGIRPAPDQGERA